MPRNLGKFQSTSFEMLKNTNEYTIEFSMETTTGTISLALPIDEDVGISVYVEGEQVFEIYTDFWQDCYRVGVEQLSDCGEERRWVYGQESRGRHYEEDFYQLFKEYFEKYIEYSVSKLTFKPIEINRTKYPFCLQFVLKKETDSGLITQVVSVVPSFHPCVLPGEVEHLNMVYKIGDATFDRLLTVYGVDYGTVHMGVMGVKKAPRIVDLGDGWFEVVKRSK